MELNKESKAIKDFDTAITINPNYTESYCYRINAYHRTKQYNKALKDCKKIIELCPDHPKVYSFLGLIYHGKRDLIKAIQSYYIAIDLFREEGLDGLEVQVEKLQEEIAIIQEEIKNIPWWNKKIF